MTRAPDRESMEGTFSLAVQEGRRACYAKVTLRVERDARGSGVELDFGPADGWKAGLQFGVAWAHERTSTPEGSHATVQVTHFRGYLVDTTEIVVAYVAAQAFYAAIGQPPPADLHFDVATGRFTFPK
jgi:hypothetical protein